MSAMADVSGGNEARAAEEMCSMEHISLVSERQDRGHSGPGPRWLATGPTSVPLREENQPAFCQNSGHFLTENWSQRLTERPSIEPVLRDLSDHVARSPAPFREENQPFCPDSWLSVYVQPGIVESHRLLRVEHSFLSG
jgi:hypothetical protein